MHSLNLTDIFSTSVEARAVMGKGQIGVLNAMQEIEQALPFKLLGIDSDNGTEFINYHLKAFCDQRQIQFTRGRPYKKDDNAHIEQKNWTHVRKILGYLRYDSQPALKPRVGHKSGFREKACPNPRWMHRGQSTVRRRTLRKWDP